ncbi:MAG: carbohydrate-binding family 9-like protein [Polyangiaceae bacterium]
MRLTKVVAAASILFATTTSAVMVQGCVGGSKGVSAEDKQRLAPYISDTEPADIPHKLDINFENKVHIIGYKVEPETAKPGTDVKLTYYWRCDDTLDEGWKLFTHVKDDVSDRMDNLDNNGPIRELKNDKQVLGPDKWEKGKYYTDEQTYKMPDWVKGPELAVMVGIWKGGARLRIIQGPNDGDNQAIVLKVKTGLVPEEHTKNDVPTLNVMKLDPGQKIVIDGKDDDEAWKAAVSTGPFVDVGTGKPNASFPVNASAKLAWDDTNLYVLFNVTDPDVIGGFVDPKTDKADYTVTGQPKDWTKETVEMMVDPDGDGDNKDYYELQINPQNKIFHSQFDSYNQPKTDPNGPFGHEDWDPKLKSAVTVQGTLDKSGDKDTGYIVEAAIPWTAYAKAKNHPPAPGDTWRVNFYAMKNNNGVAWSPIMGKGNFHFAPRFGKITWVTKDMSKPDAGAPGEAGLRNGLHIRPMGMAGMPHVPPGMHPPTPQQPVSP